MRRMVLLLCLAVAGWPAGAFGWNMPGHRVVADIAWQNMDPAVQTEAARLLRQHPDYAERFEYWRPAGFSGAEEARWRFRQGAAWADLARVVVLGEEAPRVVHVRVVKGEVHFDEAQVDAPMPSPEPQA